MTLLFSCLPGGSGGGGESKDKGGTIRAVLIPSKIVLGTFGGDLWVVFAFG